eukprot:m.52814 g.52814  ORF g.52814 m.52814 type:complete len:472 (-) comp48505_c0_seq3:143-1558(-)
MDVEEFRKAGHEMVEFIADFLSRDVHTKPVMSQVEPGYLRPQLPEDAPVDPESFQDVMKDFNQLIMPGMTHWQSEGFFAYFPARTSFASILGDFLSSAIQPIGFSWIASPACTELEMVMMDWLARASGLPIEFQFASGTGGGVIQNTASDATLVAILAARTRVARALEKEGKDVNVGSFVCYTSVQAHSSVEKGCLIAGVQPRLVATDKDLSMRGDALQAAIDADRAAGLHPCIVIATSGTTNTCAMDNLIEVNAVARAPANNIWFHVDAAYAGSALIIPEYRPLFEGITLADSLSYNCHKNMMVNFDCSPMWVRNHKELTEAFNMQPAYLPAAQSSVITDYRHWQLALGRRFRSLKVWFTLRLFGLKGLQDKLKAQFEFVKLMEELVKSDDRFIVTHPIRFGLICFKLKAGEDISKTLVDNLNKSGRMYLIGTRVDSEYTIRFAIANVSTEAFLREMWELIRAEATKLLA